MTSYKAFAPLDPFLAATAGPCVCSACKHAQATELGDAQRMFYGGPTAAHMHYGHLTAAATKSCAKYAKQGARELAQATQFVLILGAVWEAEDWGALWQIIACPPDDPEPAAATLKYARAAGLIE